MDTPDKKLIDKLYSGTMTVSAEGQVVFASQSAGDIFGYALSAMEGMPVEELFGSDMGLKIMAFLKKHEKEDLREEAFNILGICHDETIISCQVKVSASSFFDGKFVMLEIIDLNRLRHVEKKLFEKNNLFLQMANNIPGIVYKFQVRPVKKLLYISDGIRELTGYRATDFYGDNAIGWEDLVFENDLNRVAEAKVTQLDNLHKFDINYRVVRNDGASVWIKDQGKGCYDRKGRLEYIEGNMLDITDLKQKQYAAYARIMNDEDIGKSKIVSTINDNLHQSMAMASVQLQELEKEIKGMSARSRRSYGAAMKYLNNAINESRHISYDLIPQSIHDFGLIAALEDLFLMLGKQYNISIRFHSDAEHIAMNSFQKNSIFILIREYFGILMRNNILDNIRVEAAGSAGMLSFTVSAGGKNLSEDIIRNESKAWNNLENRIKALQAGHTLKIIRKSFIIFSMNVAINLMENGTD